MTTAAFRRRNQRGFSLIVVFLLILVMAGVSSSVVLSTQGDLQISGHDRESAAALYAAEAGVAWAEWYLYRFPVPMLAGSWTAFLTSVDPAVRAAFCVAAPGVPPGLRPFTGIPASPSVPSVPGQFQAPPPGSPVVYDATRGISYQFCIHNNALDPAFAPAGNPAGDLNDTDNIITIESYGWYGTGTLATGSASAHVTVDVSYFNSAVASANDYQQAGGNATKQSRGQMSPNIPASVTKSF